MKISAKVVLAAGFCDRREPWHLTETMQHERCGQKKKPSERLRRRLQIAFVGSPRAIGHWLVSKPR